MLLPPGPTPDRIHLAGGHERDSEWPDGSPQRHADHRARQIQDPQLLRVRRERQGERVGGS